MTLESKHLAVMPLHAITEVYGADGLRARFDIEIERFNTADRLRLADALALAARLHRDDRRVREPYLNHVLRVAIRPICYYDVSDGDVIIAALLHDTVEDHAPELTMVGSEVGVEARVGTRAGAGSGAEGTVVAVTAVTEAAFVVLARRFGQRAADLVRAVTNPPDDPACDRHERHRRYHGFVAESLARSPWARVIKMSDFTDNGVGVVHATGPKVASAAAKYRPLVPILRNMIASPDTPLSRRVKRHIFDQLDLAEKRFSAILDGGAARTS